MFYFYYLFFRQEKEPKSNVNTKVATSPLKKRVIVRRVTKKKYSKPSLRKKGVRSNGAYYKFTCCICKFPKKQHHLPVEYSPERHKGLRRLDMVHSSQTCASCDFNIQQGEVITVKTMVKYSAPARSRFSLCPSPFLLFSFLSIPRRNLEWVCWQRASIKKERRLLFIEARCLSYARKVTLMTSLTRLVLALVK